jgi:hypothetical protein
MELNSTIAEEVEKSCGNEVLSERRVDDGATHRRKWNSGLARLEPDYLVEGGEDRSSVAATNLHGQSQRRREGDGVSSTSAGFLSGRETAGHPQGRSGEQRPENARHRRSRK